NGAEARPASEPKHLPTPKASMGLKERTFSTASTDDSRRQPFQRISETPDASKANGHVADASNITMDPVMNRNSITQDRMIPAHTAAQRADADADAFAQYQETMRLFLLTQQRMMET